MGRHRTVSDDAITAYLDVSPAHERTRKKIAKRLRVSEATIYDRVKALIKSGKISIEMRIGNAHIYRTKDAGRHQRCC